MKLYMKFSEPFSTYESDDLSTVGTIFYVSPHDSSLGFTRRIIFSKSFPIPPGSDFKATLIAYIADLREAFCKEVMEASLEDAPKATFVTNSAN